MTKTVRIVALAVMSVSLFGCGGGARLKPGKEPAAQALYNASQPGGSSQMGLQSEGLTELFTSRALPGSGIAVSCSHGGTVTLANIVNEIVLGPGVSVDQHFDMSYNHCSSDGKTFYDGQLTTEKKVIVGGSGVYVLLTMQGHLTLSGDISDTLDVDIVEEVSVTDLSASSGLVSLKLTGSIITSSGRYDYVSESISVTAGASLEADIQVRG